MNNDHLKGLQGLKKFQSVGILLGLLVAFFFAAFVYAELTSFGSYAIPAVLFLMAFSYKLSALQEVVFLINSRKAFLTLGSFLISSMSSQNFSSSSFFIKNIIGLLYKSIPEAF